MNIFGLDSPYTLKAIGVVRGQKIMFIYFNDLNELKIMLFTVLPTHWARVNILVECVLLRGGKEDILTFREEIRS